MKKKMLFVGLTVLLLSLLMVGVASAKGWKWVGGLECSNTYLPMAVQYHWASDHKIMARYYYCENGTATHYLDYVLLDGAKYDLDKKYEYCGDGYALSYEGPQDMYYFGFGRHITFQGYIECGWWPGHWD